MKQPVKYTFDREKMDAVDLASAVLMVLAAVFVSTFFWNAAAGANGGEESFMAQLRQASEKRVKKEQAQIGFLLDLESEGKTGQALDAGAQASRRLAGNSQFHLLMARGHREAGAFPSSVAEYRNALEANRDYSDRRSSFYVGSSLRPFIRQVRIAHASSADFGDSGLRRDLFYLERSLAGGCH
jgi:hypothetical protein